MFLPWEKLKSQPNERHFAQQMEMRIWRKTTPSKSSILPPGGKVNHPLPKVTIRPFTAFLQKYSEGFSGSFPGIAWREDGRIGGSILLLTEEYHSSHSTFSRPRSTSFQEPKLLISKTRKSLSTGEKTFLIKRI